MFVSMGMWVKSTQTRLCKVPLSSSSFTRAAICTKLRSGIKEKETSEILCEIVNEAERERERGGGRK